MPYVIFYYVKICFVFSKKFRQTSFCNSKRVKKISEGVAPAPQQGSGLYPFRALARKEKNSAFCMNWGIKCCWRSGRTVSPSMSLGGPRSQALEKVTIFNLRLVWYSLLKNNKTKTVCNKKLLLWYKTCTVMFVFDSS